MRGLARPGAITGTGLGALLGLGLSTDPVGTIAGALVGGGAGWLVDRRRRGPRPARIDPFTLGEPWRRAVSDSLKARSRFLETVGRAESGPVRARLDRIGERVEEAVDTCWRVSRHGQAMAEARRRINVRSLEADIAALGRDGGERPVDEQTVAAIESQLATARRLDAVIDDTRDRLRLLNARLDEAVARTLELASRGDGSALDPVGTDIEHVADELEALRLALDETDRIDGDNT